MKKCKFCAEEIQDNAIKCRYCGEFFYKEPDVAWYFKGWFIFCCIVTVGPLALPLVILHPLYSRRKKFIISAVVIAATYIITILMAKSVKSLEEYYKLINITF